MASTVSNGNDRSEKWQRPFQMATTVYEREISCGESRTAKNRNRRSASRSTNHNAVMRPINPSTTVIDSREKCIAFEQNAPKYSGDKHQVPSIFNETTHHDVRVKTRNNSKYE